MKCCFVYVSDGMMCIEETVLNRSVYNGPPGVLGIWGEGLFIFREQLGSTAYYFRGAGGDKYILLGI